MVRKVEVIAKSNPTHQGIVDLKVSETTDEKGNSVAPNGIRWNLGK